MSKQRRADLDKHIKKRDGNVCKMCNGIRNLRTYLISPSIFFEHSGQVLENAMLICSNCYFKAHAYQIGYVAAAGYSPDELYSVISSSFRMAWTADQKLVNNIK